MEVELAAKKAKFAGARFPSNFEDYDNNYNFTFLDRPLTAAEVEKYLGLGFDLRFDPVQSMMRSSFCTLFSWAVPCEETLKEIAKFSDGLVEEHMAGGGYWAYLLRDFFNVDITCYDHGPLFKNYIPDVVWSDVVERKADEGPVKEDATIMIVWPPMGEKQYDGDALMVEKMAVGQKLIYVGESYGGCTGSDLFHSCISEFFEEVKDLDIPQWPGLHDRALFLVKEKEFNLAAFTAKKAVTAET